MTNDRPATTMGKVAALKALADRRAKNKERGEPDNAAAPAGASMVFLCIACNGRIVVSENYLSRPSLCCECAAIKQLGWLE